MLRNYVNNNNALMEEQEMIKEAAEELDALEQKIVARSFVAEMQKTASMAGDLHPLEIALMLATRR